MPTRPVRGHRPGRCPLARHTICHDQDRYRRPPTPNAAIELFSLAAEPTCGVAEPGGSIRSQASSVSSPPRPTKPSQGLPPTPALVPAVCAPHMNPSPRPCVRALGLGVLGGARAHAETRNRSRSGRMRIGGFSVRRQPAGLHGGVTLAANRAAKRKNARVSGTPVLAGGLAVDAPRWPRYLPCAFTSDSPG